MNNWLQALGIIWSVFIPIPKKNSAKECSDDRIIALISHASKIMLKILEARLQQYVNRKLPNVQAGFRKEKPEIKSPASLDHRKSREFQKNIYFCFIDYTKLKPLTVWITTNCGKYLKRWEYQTTLPVS